MSAELLDELEKNIIAGQMENKKHRLEKLKKILSKPVKERKDGDIQELIGMISQIRFFQERKEINPSDFRDLVQLFQYKESEQGKTVIKFGEPGDQFFVIIQGTLGVMIPNPSVKKWKANYQRWNKVQKWYVTEYRALYEHARSKFYAANEFLYANVEKKFKSQVKIYLGL